MKTLSATTELKDEACRARLRHEARLLSRLNHPNIATVHDLDSDSGLDFLTMESVIAVIAAAVVNARSQWRRRGQERRESGFAATPAPPARKLLISMVQRSRKISVNTVTQCGDGL